MHIYILGPTLLRWNFLSAIYTKCMGRTTFSAIFDRNFSQIVAPPSDGNKNCLAVLKGQSFLKKDENGMKIDP